MNRFVLWGFWGKIKVSVQLRTNHTFELTGAYVFFFLFCLRVRFGYIPLTNRSFSWLIVISMFHSVQQNILNLFFF